MKMEKKDRVVTIQPITRLEGHGKISIFLDDKGDVEDAYYQVVEFRGFERFCQGRPVEELPLITPRICGVCPWAHHMASAKAVDAVYHVEPPPAGRKLRELAYNAFYVHDHGAVFYALQAPDFVVGPTAPRAERNVLGVIAKVGMELVKNILAARLEATRMLEILGGRAVHPVMTVPGGVGKPITEEQRKELEQRAAKMVELAKLTLKIFDDVVLKNKEYVDLITGDIYLHKTYYMGLVDEKGKVNFYDGKLRVMAPDGKIVAEFNPSDYLNYIAEHVEPWSYLKFPYLKSVGWKGFRDGADSGIYRVGPLARLNVSNGFTTPLAQEAYEKFVSILGKPAHATLGFHWARVIEIMAAAEAALELARDPEIASKEVRRVPTATPDEGVGVVEAPRGVLIHHYKTNSEGLVEKLNLIVATVHNNAGINLSVKKAAQSLIKNWQVNDGLLNMVEMAFRPYDPCLACGTHALLGQMPLEVNIYDSKKRLYKRIARG
jgi:F420-non-reducing hydrogenase large subunit